jgi:hypothetical protein
METSEQIIEIEEGWTGISSFLIPETADIEAIFEGQISNLEFLTDNAQFFQPGNLNSALTEWNAANGYMIKASQPFVLTFEGYPEKSNRVNLPAGWNLLSISVDHSLPVDELVTEPANAIQVIKEACGWTTFWPDQEVHSLQNLQPGKSYFIKLHSDAVLILE